MLQVFSKFGKVTKLDFLFHKTGPSKGKPRGYAFVEYRGKDVRPISYLRCLCSDTLEGCIEGFSECPRQAPSWAKDRRNLRQPSTSSRILFLKFWAAIQEIRSTEAYCAITAEAARAVRKVSHPHQPYGRCSSHMIGLKTRSLRWKRSYGK